MANTFLHYTVSGEGKPVVFLHGFMEDSSMWNELIVQLPIKAYCIDLHGHGKSPFLPEARLSIKTMAEQVYEIIRAEKLENAIIVGHSLGGYVALELFQRNQEFEHIVLFHSHPWNDSLEKQLDRERVAKLVLTKKDIFIHEAIPNLFFHEHPIAKEKYILMAKLMLPEAIAWNALAMKNREDNSDLLKMNPSRFTCVIGEQDKLVNVNLLKSFCQSTGVNTIVLAEVGHMAHEEAKKQTHELFEIILH